MIEPLYICIPTFNRIDRLKLAVSSLLTQVDKNFRVLILDNHSTDGTKEYVQTLRVHGWEIINNDTNLGMAGNINKGIERISTGWITFLCDDDYLAPEFTQVLNQKIATTKASVVLGSHTLEDEFGNWIGDCPKNEDRYYTWIEALHAGLAKKSLHSAGISGFAMRKSALRTRSLTCTFRDYPGGFFSDTLLFYQATLESGLEVSDKRIYHKVNWCGSATGQLDINQWRMAKYYFIRDMLKIMETYAPQATDWSDMCTRVNKALIDFKSEDTFGRSTPVIDFVKYHIKRAIPWTR